MPDLKKSMSFSDLIRNGVLEIGDGYRAKLEELGGSGPLFLRAGALSVQGFSWSGLDAFRADLREKLESKIGRSGDVVITTKGNSIGRTGWVPTSAPTFVYSPHLSYWRSLDHSVLVPRYLYYWSRSEDFLDQLHRLGYGTDMAPYLSLRDQAQLRIVVPAARDQHAVAAALGALDDKIAANDHLITMQEELATCQWRRGVAGGVAVPLSSLAWFVNGKAFTKDASGTGRVVVRIAELNSGLGGSTVYNDIEVSNDHVARPGDLLFAWSGSLTVARWFRPEAIVNQHIFKVIPIDGYPMWLVNQAIRTKLAEFKAIAADKATTMGHIQRRHLDEAVVVPSKEAIDRLGGLMTGLWERSLSTEQENLSLAATRDELLPLLMSGKVRVRDAEKVVEEVV